MKSEVPLTPVSWFFKLFKESPIRVISIPAGFEIMAEGRLRQYDTIYVESAILSFIEEYIGDLRRANLEYSKNLVGSNP